MSNTAIVISLDDRAGHAITGNILAESEERIVKELAEKLPRMRKFSTNAVAIELGVDFPLAKRLRSKAIAKWRTDHGEEVELQKEKIRRWADEIETLPPACSRVQQIKNTIELYEKLNGLEKLSPNLFDMEGGETRFIVTGRIGKNMLEIFAQHKKVNLIEQDGNDNNGGGDSDKGTEGTPIQSDQ